MIKRMLEKFSLKIRLMLFVTGIAFLIIFVLTIIFIVFASNSIQDEVQAQVESIGKTKKELVLRFFEDKDKDVIILSTTSDVKNAFQALKKGFNESSNIPLKIRQSYIEKNPFGSERKSEYLKASDSTKYSQEHEKYHSFFQKYIRVKSFYDLFLIDLEGNIIYSVSKEDDFGTNLLTGSYKDSNLSKVFQESKNQGSIGIVSFSDFRAYPPSNHRPASFLATPIFINGSKIGVLAVQISTEELNSLMINHYLTDSSSIYLVGYDRFFRSNDHRYPNEKFILHQKNNSLSVQKALDGAIGIILEKNYRGTEVYTAYSPITIHGMRFAILSEFHSEAAMYPLRQITNKILIAFLIIFAFVISITLALTQWIANPITKVINMLSSSTREIATTIEQQEKTAQMQSASVNQTSTTMEELGATSRQNAEQTVTVSEKSQEAQTKATEGAELVMQMVQSMQELRINVDTISKQILDLSEKNNQISEIINLVSDIAIQTNMLALNAAVEAARAGEYGKGFAVVAVEIRKLADESNFSSEKIQEILLEIKKSTDNTVMAAEEGIKKVERSVNFGISVEGSFLGIRHAIDTVFQSLEQISLNIRQQSIAINEIVQAMDSLNRGSEETAVGISQIKQGVSQVNDAASEMKVLIDGKND
ncbi:MAG: hypothetical protein CK427_11330 [Leptospira sp.]|nr:MAG: hypothetical protein CK427_11330 [Leptospira sp.]